MNKTKDWAIRASTVGLAFVLGCWAKRWLPSPSQSELVSQDVRVDSANDSAHSPPTTMTEADVAEARSAIVLAPMGGNPEHAALASLDRLLESARTNEDFQRIVALFNETSHSELFWPMLEVAFERWGRLDPKAALAAVGEVQYLHNRYSLLAGFMPHWARRDPQAAMAALEEIAPGTAKNEGMRMVIQTLAEQDPETTIHLAREWEKKNWAYVSGLAHDAFQTWAKKDPQAALAYADAAPKEDKRSFLHTAIQELAQKDRALAWQEVLKRFDPHSAQRQDFLSDLIDSRWRLPMEERQSLVLSLPEGEARTDLMGVLGYAAAREGMKEAEAHLANLKDESLRQRWIGGMVDALHQDGHHPQHETAAQWAAQIADPERRLELFSDIGRTWSRFDTPGASEWLAKLAPSPERDAFLQEFVKGALPTGPEAALAWAREIQDRDARERLIRKGLEAWRKKDPAAVDAWSSAGSEPAQP